MRGATVAQLLKINPMQLRSATTLDGINDVVNAVMGDGARHEGEGYATYGLANVETVARRSDSGSCTRWDRDSSDRREDLNKEC